jgi:hypothetical protein
MGVFLMEIAMLTLPSGRRVAFSLDRFHAFLQCIGADQARSIAGILDHPDDLLFVLDAVHFSVADGTPYFADYVASERAARTADWSAADRQALEAWFASDEARAGRAEAIRYIKELTGDGAPTRYPYRIVDHVWPYGASRTRQ